MKFKMPDKITKTIRQFKKSQELKIQTKKVVTQAANRIFNSLQSPLK